MVELGTTASITYVAEENATAIALGSGDVRVLGTPKIVALIEEAAVAALSGLLADGSTTVGTHIAVDHLAPTGVGGSVVASATVTKADGSKVTFSATVHEGDTVVARASHTRVVVDRKRFEDAAARTV